MKLLRRSLLQKRTYHKVSIARNKQHADLTIHRRTFGCDLGAEAREDRLTAVYARDYRSQCARARQCRLVDGNVRFAPPIDPPLYIDGIDAVVGNAEAAKGNATDRCWLVNEVAAAGCAHPVPIAPQLSSRPVTVRTRPRSSTFYEPHHSHKHHCVPRTLPLLVAS